MDTKKSLLNNPSAWLPLFMSVVALLLVVFYIAFFGISQQPRAEEGTAARIFQLLLAGQVPFIAFFAFKWLPKNPRQGIFVIVVQIAAALVPFGTIFFIGV